MDSTYQPKISEEAVLKASGRKWDQWFSELEKKGFLQLSHKDAAKRIQEDYEVSSWWAQSIIVEFERKFGKRQVNETKNGFEVSVSKTFNYPVNDVFGIAHEWFEQERRVEIRTDDKHRRLRGNWLTDDSRFAVHFNPKGTTKTQMVVQHEKLSSEGDVDVMRNFWKERLNQMVESL